MLESITHAIHRRLLFVLIAIYLFAAFVPGPGLAIRASASWLLGALLFMAAIGIETRDLREVLRRPRLALLGVGVNALLPVVLGFATASALSGWHNSTESESVIVALAIVGAMPIAGSSAGWAKNASGNMALSVALLLVSCIVSPLLAPFAFESVARVTHGDFAEDMRELATAKTQLFLAATVVVPTALGLVVRKLLGDTRAGRLTPFTKPANLGILLVLNYVNACTALPKVRARPDYDFLALLVACSALLGALDFVVGWLLGVVTKAKRAERVSLVFGLGMSNNGSGLVLATTALADHEEILLAIAVYNLVQQIVASIADYALRIRSDSEAKLA